MIHTYDHVLSDVLTILRQLADDWEYDQEISAESRLLSDLGLESLDLVVLGAALQRHFDQQINFSEFLADLGRRNMGDVTVGEWVDFIAANLEPLPNLKPEETGL
ncbi:MAG: acyl carrier protein [Oscillochloris sp.]|nr:acyl carrier protein [Oscillochloris sp.]